MTLTMLFRFDYFLTKILCPDDVLAPTQLAQATLYEYWKVYEPPLDHAPSFSLTALFAKIILMGLIFVWFVL